MTEREHMLRSRPWQFLLAAVASSWTLWCLAVGIGGHMSHTFSSAMLIAGVFCIPVSALCFIFAAHDPDAAGEFWRRLFDVRRLSAAGALTAVFLLPAVACVAALFDFFSAGRVPHFAMFHGPDFNAANLIKALGFGLVVGPFLEEVGWRGYALRPLEIRYGALAGALTIACVHAAWHLPLFFYAGTYQQRLGAFTLDFWRFMLSMAAFDILAAALFNAMSDSVLAAVLFHCSFNLAGGLFDLSPAGAWVKDALTVTLAILVILGTRGRLFLKSIDRAALRNG